MNIGPKRIGWLVAAMLTAGVMQASEVATKPEAVKPILVGQKIPKLMVKDANGKALDLNAAVAEKPTLLIFYRGGWCPYCNKHLKQIQGIQSQLQALGCQIIAVSPDRPALLSGAVGKHKLQYRLVSDSEMKAAKALGLAFKLESALVRKYKTEYKIDIEADSGQTHHQLPVPAALLIDKDGTVHFTYINPNYATRAEPSVVLAAAKAMVAK